MQIGLRQEIYRIINLNFETNEFLPKSTNHIKQP